MRLYAARACVDGYTRMHAWVSARFWQHRLARLYHGLYILPGILLIHVNARVVHTARASLPAPEDSLYSPAGQAAHAAAAE